MDKKGRLDYCLIAPDLTEQLINVKYQYTTSTGHASIIIEIGTEEEEYGKVTFRAPPPTSKMIQFMLNWQSNV